MENFLNYRVIIILLKAEVAAGQVRRNQVKIIKRLHPFRIILQVKHPDKLNNDHVHQWVNKNKHLKIQNCQMLMLVLILD